MRQYEIRMQGQVAEISIIGDINWWSNSSADFTNQFEGLRAAGVTELRGYINSGGGSMWEANEIYNLISGFKGRKTCRLGALVASAATTIACAFTDGVEMAANGQYMIHNPQVSVEGGAKEINAALQLYDNLRAGAVDIYTRFTGLPAAEISAMMEATTWMTAATAKSKGFVKSISGGTAELPTDTAEVLNKYHYKEVPAVLNQALNAPAPAPRLVQPANQRAGWTLTDWQANASEELAAMMQAETPLFRQLYQQHYGEPWNGLVGGRQSNPTRTTGAARNTAPPTSTEQGTEPPRRSLLEQLPKLGELFNVLLTTSGEAIDEATAHHSDRLARRMEGHEKVMLEVLDCAGGMVPGTEASSYLLAAWSVLERVTKDAENPVRRLLGRKQGIEAHVWAAYANRWREVVSLVQKGAAAAEQPTAANYEVAAPPKGREGWNLQKWMDEDPDGLQRVRKDNPNLFRQLYRERFGIDPEI